MYLSKEAKGRDLSQNTVALATNTGSTEAQVALFTARIAHLTGHLKKNKKDFSTQLSLQKLVGKRRGLLAYLYKKDIGRYRAIIKALSFGISSSKFSQFTIKSRSHLVGWLFYFV
jgi:small subunit ribosomal protein S15